MALSRTAWQTSISDVSTAAQYTLGTLREYQHPTYGPQVWRYIQSRDAVIAGTGVMQENGLDEYECTLSGAGTPNVRVFGAAQHAIPSGSFGFVLADGVGIFVSDGTTGANAVQVCAAGGQFTNGTAVTSEGIIWAQQAQAVAGATFQGYIRAL